MIALLPWPDLWFPALHCVNTSAPTRHRAASTNAGIAAWSTTVRSAEIAGVPVAVIGIVGYAAIAGFALARRWWIVLVLTTVAVGFSIYLTYVEAQSYWRLTASGASRSAGIIALTEIVAILAVVRRRKPAAIAMVAADPGG